LTKVIVTGAACPQETKRAVIQWWGPVLDEAYGGTESGTVCRIDSTEWLARPGSVGQALPGYELLIVDADDQPVPPGVPGRIFVRDASGRGVQYHNAPEKTRAVHLGPGVFPLGDVGYVDEQGYLYITDRDVDMVVSGGVNIYPAEVERVLIEHPAVSDVAVLGVPHPDMGEELRALVAVRPGAPTPTAAELEQFCRARLAGYKCPRHYEVVEALPRDAMGKLNKRRLRQDFWPETRTVGG
jgi:long-chain acyl-CoA synthetase